MVSVIKFLRTKFAFPHRVLNGTSDLMSVGIDLLILNVYT